MECHKYRRHRLESLFWKKILKSDGHLRVVLNAGVDLREDVRAGLVGAQM